MQPGCKMGSRRTSKLFSSQSAASILCSVFFHLHFQASDVLLSFAWCFCMIQILLLYRSNEKDSKSWSHIHFPHCRDTKDSIVETAEFRILKWKESWTSVLQATRLRKINRALLNRDLIHVNSIWTPTELPGTQLGAEINKMTTWFFALKGRKQTG